MAVLKLKLLLLALLLATAAAARDFYKLLGVKKSADEAEIKRAYR